MKIFVILWMTLLFFVILVPPISALADDANTSATTSREGGPTLEGPDFLDNGTLYNDSIHHRRPARDINLTWKEKRKRSKSQNVSASFFSNFRSRYVAYGRALSDGWVWQPSATVEWYGLGFNVWSNFVIEDRADRGKVNEINLTLYYDYKIHNFTIHPFFMILVFPTQNRQSLDFSSHTIYRPALHLAYSVSLLDVFVDLEIYAHPNPGALRGEMGLGLTHHLPLKFGLETSALVGFSNAKYNRGVFKIPDTAFTFFTYNIAFPWNPVKGFVVKPTAFVSTFFSDRFRNATRYPIQVWGGVDFSYHL